MNIYDLLKCVPPACPLRAFIYVRVHACKLHRMIHNFIFIVPHAGRISRDALHQVPANQPQQRQQQQQQQKKAKPPPVAPKPNRKFSSTSTLSDTSDYSDCSGNVTGGDSGFCDRKQWVNSAKIEVPKPLQGTT